MKFSLGGRGGCLEGVGELGSRSSFSEFSGSAPNSSPLILLLGAKREKKKIRSHVVRYFPIPL